nr:phosphatase [Evansella cellulosilytica]
MFTIKVHSLKIGLTIMVISAVLYAATLITASIYSIVLIDIGSWNSEFGLYGSALREVGTLPLTLAISFAVVGVYFIIIGITYKETK